ncbi:MAG: VWA domain-containing protein [Candidatus Sumerlaeia bacterium]|nr:VWA domain-containing protein [Candidatus Sumerlaeia bacterium]
MTDWINHFQHPWVLLLLPLPIIWLVWHVWKGAVAPSVTYSSLDITKGLPVSLRQRVLNLLPYSRAAVLMLGIIALSRPQHGAMEYDVSARGIDIVMCIDVSGSMQASDFHPNRMEAAKKAAAEFVRSRERDRVAVTLFAPDTAVLAPFTLDMNALSTLIESIYIGIISPNGTAIGDGIAASLRLLEDSDAESKVIVLLTDGENNTGKIQPLQAADIARAMGVRVYTIGMGRDSRAGGGLFGGRADFDSAELIEIAERTGGRYLHASNDETLTQVYQEIDELERSELDVTETATYTERFMYFWFPALVLLLGEFALRALWIRRLP